MGNEGRCEKCGNVLQKEGCPMCYYLKYDSTKLEWCNYPFENDPLGYCWGYAGFVDGTLMVKGEKITDMKKYCETCDLNKRHTLTNPTRGQESTI